MNKFLEDRLKEVNEKLTLIRNGIAEIRSVGIDVFEENNRREARLWWISQGKYFEEKL